jgi:hypothetical protein
MRFQREGALSVKMRIAMAGKARHMAQPTHTMRPMFCSLAPPVMPAALSALAVYSV